MRNVNEEYLKMDTTKWKVLISRRLIWKQKVKTRCWESHLKGKPRESGAYRVGPGASLPSDHSIHLLQTEQTLKPLNSVFLAKVYTMWIHHNCGS